MAECRITSCLMVGIGEDYAHLARENLPEPHDRDTRAAIWADCPRPLIGHVGQPDSSHGRAEPRQRQIRTLLGDCLNDPRMDFTVLVLLLHHEALLAR